MISRIFPRQADNAFGGRRLAIWLLVPCVLVRGIEGVNSIVMTRQIAMGADGIPLDTYGAAAAAAVTALFALLGLSVLLLALVVAVVLIRYRALIPFGYLLLLTDLVASKVINMLHPMARAAGEPVGAFPAGAVFNYGLLGLLILGFVLSLIPRRKAK
jgi:hypothetical protein